MPNPEFLKSKYPNLSKSPEVKSATMRTEIRTKKDPPIRSLENADERIQNYLDRFKEIIERNDSKKKEQGINALKKILIDRYVVRVEDIPEAYWQAQMRVVRGRGEFGDWQDLLEEEKQKIKQEHLAQTKEDQKGSLEEWIDYLVSPRSSFLPDYLKYWVFQSMLKLERYEKGNKELNIAGRFPQRPSGTERSVKMFPEVNDRALRFIAEAYKAQEKSESIHFRYDIPKEAKQKFLENLGKKNFRALYEWGQEYIPPISDQEMQSTDGEWVLYEQGSDASLLAKSLQGKGSGWCIAGQQLAKNYLTQGNLHIYYTPDREDKLIVPRVVIVEVSNRVTEVRGIEWQENVDAYIKSTDIIKDKLEKLPNGTAFFDIDQDTKQLTAIDKKISAGDILTRDDLIFLYEIEKPIKYFGYKKDPRIAEIRTQRNLKEDVPIVFGCEPSQVAWSLDEVAENTQAYIGKWNPEIYNKLPSNITHLYESFPEKKIFRYRLETKPEMSSFEETKRILQTKSIYISPYAEDLLRKTEFSKESKIYNLIQFTVEQLGFPNGATTDEIYRKAKEFGLKLCPTEVGPQLRLVYKGKDWKIIAMEQISDRDGGMGVFFLGSDDVRLELYVFNAFPHFKWNPNDQFVFVSRK